MSADFEITLGELQGRIGGGGRFVLVEAMSPAAYEDAHLPGAVNLPPGSAAELAPGLLPDKDAEIVVYCSGPT